jgi:methyl-accepting chemotaxis protein
LLQSAKADLKKELAHFNVSTLIGTNIDVFHKNTLELIAASKEDGSRTSFRSI